MRPSVEGAKLLSVKPLRLVIPPLAPPLPHDARRTDSELAEVVAAWPRLTAKARAAIVAIARDER